MKKSEVIRINIKPLSVNECWRGKRFPTPAYSQYKRDLAILLPKIILPLPPYQLTLKFGFSSIASDWDNCIKPTQDCIAKKYGFNDKLIRRAVIETVIVPKGKEFFEFSILHIE